MKARITATAMEKLSPAAYEALDRSVTITLEFDVEDGAPDLDARIADTAASLQMRCEAQMYAALSRAMASRGNPTGWLRAAAVDRAGRVGTIETIETQTTSAAAVDRGVLN